MKTKKYLFAAATSIAIISLPALAQSYPSKPIRIVVPYTAGGLADNVTRLISEKLSTRMGQPVIVENRPGGKQIIATDYVMKSAPDGYTLLLGSVTNLSINPAGINNLPYSVEKDLSPIAHLFYSPLLLVTNLPVSSTKDLINTLKNPAGKYSYASVGPGTSTHIAGEFLSKVAKLDSVHIPYKGSASAITDLVGGQVNYMFDGGTSALPFVKAGRIKLLAVTSAERFPTLPNTPTMIESGYKDFEISAWWGILAPSKTPTDVIDKLYKNLKEITEDKVFQSQMLTNGVALQAKSPADFSAFIKTETKRWGNLLNTTGISIND